MTPAMVIRSINDGNEAYSILKSHTPGAYIFILKASKEISKNLSIPRRKPLVYGCQTAPLP
jgi:tRNA A37 threonylcarbamoyladenosine synthetase subunit TsaC/SUA5/YrdC